MIETIVEILGPFTYLPWLPELIAGIMLVGIGSLTLSFVFMMMASIFKF